MIIIAHRGLLEGPNSSLENHPDQIDLAIKEGFDVELDLRYIDKEYWLGHDNAQFLIDLDWLEQRSQYLWVHCKNIDALLRMAKTSLHYFWHEEDTVTLTSKRFIWAYPGKQPIKRSIAVMPEIHNDTVDQCMGVCTDYAYNYRAMNLL
jgi:hypothetical protein